MLNLVIPNLLSKDCPIHMQKIKGVRMFEKINKWWHGELYFLDGVYPGERYRHHWTARVAHELVNFYLEHWKWLLVFFVSVVALYIGYLKL